MQRNYFPNYFTLEDITVTNEKVECRVNSQLAQMGFLDSGNESKDLIPGQLVRLPIWYVKELKMNNPYFTVAVPEFYKNVHKAVCEADTTHIELGKLHPHFYELGRYLTPYDRNHVIGKIVFETLRQRVRYLLDISKALSEDDKPEHRLDDIELKLFECGQRTSKLLSNWLETKSNKLAVSEMVSEHNRKRRREAQCEDDRSPQNRKRPTL